MRAVMTSGQEHPKARPSNPAPRRRRERRVLLGLAVALVACAPLLSGYTNGCSMRMHAVHPTFAACPDCGPAGPFLQIVDAKQKIQDLLDGGIGPGAVVALGTPSNWSEIELCWPGSTVPSWLPSDPHVVAQPDTKTCDGAPCRCWYDLRALGNHLAAFVSPQPGGEELNLMLQLSPILTTQRSLPSYFPADVALNDPAVIAAYNALWDEVSRLLADPSLQGAQFLVSAGNEVNFYLNDPKRLSADPIGNPIPAGEETDAYNAWTQYLDFFTQVGDHIRNTQAGESVDCFKANPPPSCQGQNLVFFPRVVTATSTWYGHCGLKHATEAACNDVAVSGQGSVDFTNFIRDLNDGSDATSMTYYPPHAVVDLVMQQGQLTEEEAITFVVAFDIAAMVQARPDDNLVFLQEVGLSSDRFARGYNTSVGDGLYSQRQSTFQSEVFGQWADQDAAKLWLRGVSMFAMHDFDAEAINKPGTLPFLGQMPSCSSNTDCQQPPLDLVNLECVDGACAGVSCSADSDCLNVPPPTPPTPPALVCCTNGARCSPVGRCVVPSSCDFVTPPIVDPTKTPPEVATCPDGDDALCLSSGGVCGSDHRCHDELQRASLCGLGLRTQTGAEKTAWTAFQNQSQLFDESSVCTCPDNVYPCQGVCPGAFASVLTCEQWQTAQFGVCVF